MKDAEANAEADAKRKEEVDLRNEVDQAIFATEKTIKETEGKGFDTERDAAQSALDDLKKAQESGNLDDMKAKLEALNEKLKLLQLNFMNKLQQHNKLKQEQKVHKQQITQATTS